MESGVEHIGTFSPKSDCFETTIFPYLFAILNSLLVELFCTDGDGNFQPADIT